VLASSCTCARGRDGRPSASYGAGPPAAVRALVAGQAVAVIDLRPLDQGMQRLESDPELPGYPRCDA
jgi:hypothetical protein